MARPHQATPMALAFVLLCAATLTAQGTHGRIAGHVWDPGSRPLQGVEVSVLGAERFATSDASGFFVLHRIPSGTYTVRFQTAGFRVLEIVNVQVGGGASIWLDAALEAGAPSDTPTVQRAGLSNDPADPTTRYSVPASLIAELPVDDLDGILSVMPGVSQAGASSDVSLRATDLGEAVTLLNGIPVRSMRTGTFLQNPGITSLAEVTQIPGAGSEFGDAHGGVLNLVTKSGGATLEGDVRFSTDEVFGSGTSLGFNRFDGSVSGPIGNRFRFYVGGTLQKQSSAARPTSATDVPAYVIAGVDTTVTVDLNGSTATFDMPAFALYNGTCDPAENHGVDCQGRRYPLELATFGNAVGRFDFSYGRGSLTFTGMLDMAQGRAWPGTLSFDPEAYQGTRLSGGIYALSWTHDLLRDRNRYLTLEASVSYQTDSRTTGSLDSEWERSHRSATGGFLLSPMEFLVDRNRFSSDTGEYAITRLESAEHWDQLTENFWTDRGTRVPFDGRGEIAARATSRVNPWAARMGFPLAGPAPGFPNTELADESRRWARMVLDWRPSRIHNVRAGGEYQAANVRYFFGHLTSVGGADTFSESPSRFAAFVSDRIDFDRLHAELGLRWEQFGTDALYPVAPGRIFTNPAYDPNDPTTLDSVLAPAETHSVVLPRVAAGLRIGAGTGVRLSYSRRASMPSLESTMRNKNTDLANASRGVQFGQDVGFVESTLLEIGIQHNVGNRVVLGVSGYRREYHADYGFIIQPVWDPFLDGTTNLSLLSDVNAGAAHGVEVVAQAQGARWLGGQLSYTYQDADETTAGGITREHTFAGYLHLVTPDDFGVGVWYGSVLRGLEATVRFRAASGLRYTRLANRGSGILAPWSVAWNADIIEPLNASRLPWVKDLDLRVVKEFRVAAMSLRAFLDFRNLLNTENVQQIFAETGETENDIHRERWLDTELLSFEQDALASSAWVQISKEGRTVAGVDLAIDCSTWQGGGGGYACFALQRAERRWGNGDDVYDVEEFTAGLNALYELFYGRSTLLGAGRQIRMGVEVQF